MVCTARDLNTFVTALGTLKNFDTFPFEVEGCGDAGLLEFGEDVEGVEKPHKDGLELAVENPENDDPECVLGV